MDATVTFNREKSDREREAQESWPVRIRKRLFFAWVILCGFVSIMITTTLYLLSGGPLRDPSVYRTWNVRMAKILLFSTRIKVETTYRSTFDLAQPYMFVSNHQSFLDIPIAALVVPCPFGFVAKIELSRIPFLGHAIRYSPSVFLDRSNPRKSLESMNNAAQAIRNGTSVIMYPEGGRSFSKTLRPFKKGAFLLAVKAGVPIVPVTIKDAYKVLNERSHAAQRGTVHVIVGEPIPMSGYDRREIPALMERIASIMRSELEEGAGTS